ncbi:phosphatidylserine decarboxylase family protein [Streptomyces sp. UNOC14_S4]|uniref:phosphatidylserine decarboxylase family protein n=1 Tax=Streptomyces sp. UNOC14_S4 TaxID=2872340 RepID=UPI001E59C786|nr:phosphatidylserine decarboxylase family protein [Streptomyces sp. UNOC14_S4]MCC3768390.1 phosphatidylserine decarboxylase family protein [Streptomyces sp. UNOC14_S4]
MSAAAITAQELHSRYQNTFGRVGGYLPRNPLAIDEFQKSLAPRAVDLKDDLAKSVREFAEFIHSDGIARMYVSQMIDEVPEEHRHIRSIDDLIQYLNVVVGWAPSYDRDPQKLIALPMSALFGYMRLTKSGHVAFRLPQFNDALRKVMDTWYQYLNSAESTHVLNTRNWFSQPAIELNKLYEYECWDHRGEDYWGFTSFNDFFHRRIKLDEFRQLAGEGDPSVITAPADGTVYNMARGVARSDEFWLKEVYSLENMLWGPQCGSEYVSKFVGGDVYQSFLSVNSFHRWNVPVDGTIKHLEKVPGLMFSHLEMERPDPTTYTSSQSYQANVNTRGLAFIECGPELGNRMVCQVVIGMEEVSSIDWSVKVGDQVHRGQELGYFSYGGSSMALVFEQGIVNEFTVPQNDPHTHPDDGPTVFVRSQIARAS